MILAKNDEMFQLNSVLKGKNRENMEQIRRLEVSRMSDAKCIKELEELFNKSQERIALLETQLTETERVMASQTKKYESYMRLNDSLTKENHELKNFKLSYLDKGDSIDTDLLIKLRKTLPHEQQSQKFFDLLIKFKGEMDRVNSHSEKLEKDTGALIKKNKYFAEQLAQKDKKIQSLTNILANMKEKHGKKGTSQTTRLLESFGIGKIMEGSKEGFNKEKSQSIGFHSSKTNPESSGKLFGKSLEEEESQMRFGEESNHEETGLNEASLPEKPRNEQKFVRWEENFWMKSESNSIFIEEPEDMKNSTE